MICAICTDYFVAAQMVIPCGHLMCGPCITGWINTSSQQNAGATCPSCRARLDQGRPMLPNIHTDNMIEHHLNALGKNGVEGWEIDGLDGEDGWGYKRGEWQERWRTWRESQQKANGDNRVSATNNGNSGPAASSSGNINAHARVPRRRRDNEPGDQGGRSRRRGRRAARNIE
ncbi:hypothetical protein BOTBODRAFT_311416 [Botryobasidium botryosum FD-172 SS1]|uniref:RING-type domain-containing protein n=1 Tax=Botryobasidium botryosum (strain FD-172 SS1) TaxID=930990 RepID=A0A067MY75_BOTB1|nr:hypothetical protein BOTBODRAFT_311416 [Botryobasidium botryosum FD-172 SS1]